MMSLCRIVALILSVCLNAPIGFEECNDSQLLNNNLGDNFDVIEFNLTAETLAKTTVIAAGRLQLESPAVGFSVVWLMPNTDVICYMYVLHSNGTQSTENGWTVHHKYAPDNQQSQKLVQLRETNYTNNIFLCRFSRQKFCTNASADRNLTTPWYILMLWGMDPTKPHNVDDMFASMCHCNDYSEHYSCIDKFKLLLLNGMVMTLTLFLSIAAVIHSCYYRNIFTAMWFKILMIIEVCMLSGLIFILGHTGGQFSAGLLGLHQIIRIVTIGLAVFQEKMKCVKKGVVSKGVETEEGGSTRSLTATEVIDDTYNDGSLRATISELQAAQHEAAISKQECAELENKVIEMEKKMAVLQDNYEQQADQLKTQCKAIDAYDVSLKASKTKLEAAQHEAAISKQECTELENKINEMEREKAVLRDNYEQQADQLETLQHKAASSKLAVEVEVQVDTLSDDIQEYKERLQASEEEEQRLLQALESKQKMERARNAQISNLKTTQELQEKRYNESLKASKAEKQHLLQVLELRQKMEHARDAQILRLRTSNKVLQEKCDELMADDDEKQQLLNFMIQVCRPKDWQILLLLDRLADIQLAISSSSRYYSQKRLDNVLKAVKSWPTVYTSNTVIQADYLVIAPVKHVALKDQTIHKKFIGLLLYKQIAKNVVTFHLVVVEDLEPYLKVVREEYKEWYEDDTSLPIIFKADSNSVQLKLEKLKMGSWKIFPLINPMIITKSAVTDFQPGIQGRIPYCAIRLMSSDKNPKDLEYLVNLIGATDLVSFYLRYPQPESCKVSDQLSRECLFSLTSSTASATSEKSNSLSVTTLTSPSTIPINTTPTLLDLKTMKGADGTPLRIMETVAAGDYMTFGMCLLRDKNGVVVKLIKRNNIQDGTESVTQAIIEKWLTSGRICTYQHLIVCLKQSELGALAEDIVKNCVQQ